jgi:hypothetical protein
MMEPHHDGASLVLLCHSRRIYWPLGDRVGGGKQSDCRGPDADC